MHLNCFTFSDSEAWRVVSMGKLFKDMWLRYTTAHTQMYWLESVWRVILQR
jgi:hypothetical protein